MNTKAQSGLPLLRSTRLCLCLLQSTTHVSGLRGCFSHEDVRRYQYVGTILPHRKFSIRLRIRRVYSNVRAMRLLCMVIKDPRRARVIRPGRVKVPLPNVRVNGRQDVNDRTRRVNVAFRSHRGDYFKRYHRRVVNFPNKIIVQYVFANGSFQSFAIVIVVTNDVNGRPIKDRVVVLIRRVRPSTFRFKP